MSGQRPCGALVRLATGQSLLAAEREELLELVESLNKRLAMAEVEASVVRALTEKLKNEADESFQVRSEYEQGYGAGLMRAVEGLTS